MLIASMLHEDFSFFSDHNKPRGIEHVFIKLVLPDLDRLRKNRTLN